MQALSQDEARRTARIRDLNDKFRRTFTGGRVMLTSGFCALPKQTRDAAIARIKSFDAFKHDNDPHGEHDFVSIDIGGKKVFAKIDYYDRNIRYGADDPSDPEHTTRIMTIMLAEEY